MATWRDGLSEIEREMFAYSESVGLSPYSHTPEKRERKVRLPNEEDMSAQPDPRPDPDAWRLVTTAWCSCKRCEVMPTSRECVCGRECPPAVTAQPEGCVTEHADFSLICLQAAVLRVAFWALQEAGHNPAQGEQRCSVTLRGLQAVCTVDVAETGAPQQTSPACLCRQDNA
ncbi:uncharacterized protein LOC120840037 [Ixodes scapularis]|uniref:uncharacterized protein LOC120840037 n=1 Tax=Ixodes scapularis TaxID=6945 RepID=UPI001A9EBDE3|nr:uncharacterized protein LOC120840037 [Ixodes scapularis]